MAVAKILTRLYKASSLSTHCMAAPHDLPVAKQQFGEVRPSAALVDVGEDVRVEAVPRHAHQLVLERRQTVLLECFARLRQQLVSGVEEMIKENIVIFIKTIIYGN